MEKKLIYSALLDFYGGMLTEKQQYFAELYYDQDLSLGEISELEGISRQGVHDNLKRCEEYMDELEQKLGLYKKYKESTSKRREITALCDKARSLVKPYLYLKELDNIIAEISEKITELEENA